MCALERFHRQLAARSCFDLACVLGGLLPERELAFDEKVLDLGKIRRNFGFIKPHTLRKTDRGT